MSIVIAAGELQGKRCCGNCLGAKIVPYTDGAEWRCAASHAETRGGRVTTKLGRMSASLRTPRGCRQFDSMDAEVERRNNG